MDDEPSESDPPVSDEWPGLQDEPGTAIGPETAVEWRPFTAATLEAAERDERPIHLSLTATWCRECHEMDREVYADPDVAERIERDFLPVRADVDRRPRVRDRYNVGGFPSTVFLTPTGEVLTGATALGRDAFLDVLARVGDVWAERGADAGRVPRAVRSSPPAGDLDGTERLVAEQLRSAFDPDHGGWGTGPKFPLPRTVEFALKRDPELATRTLDPIRQHLLDTFDGGFFRYAENGDWSDPHREKLADENGALCRAFANAYLHTGDTAYRETAADVVGFLTSTLWTGEAVAGSQAPAPAAYYRGSPSEREAAEAPPVDPAVFADRNAAAVDGLLAYHAYTDDEAAKRYARRILDALADLVDDDGAVSHYDGTDAPVGLLADQASVARAFAAAAQVLGRSHERTAAAVADHAIATLRTDDGFADGPRSGPGLLSRPLYSVDGAAALADALIDVWALTGEERYRESAREALTAFGGARERFGPQVAAYAAAVSRLDGPLRIEVATPPGSTLHRAALRVADHEKVVLPDATEPPEGAAVAVVDGIRTEPAESPDELVGRLDGRLA